MNVCQNVHEKLQASMCSVVSLTDSLNYFKIMDTNNQQSYMYKGTPQIKLSYMYNSSFLHFLY